ncbi:MAG: hypothetical protein PWP24_166 [Clostridiales bacterium]|nr:hypothetical protein [Clostridiales bacterium]
MDIMERIFYAGIEEFRDYGIKFTMDGLASRLGISKRTLYESISSKEKVVELVIDRTFADIKKQQKEILDDEEQKTDEKIKKLLSIIPSYSDMIDYRQVIEIGKVYPKLYKKIEDGIEGDWEATISLLEKGIEEGMIRPYSLVIIKELFCLAFERLLDGRFLIRNGITYDKALEEVTEILFNGILVVPEEDR